MTHDPWARAWLMAKIELWCSVWCCRGLFLVRPCLAGVAHGLSDKLIFPLFAHWFHCSALKEIFNGCASAWALLLQGQDVIYLMDLYVSLQSLLVLSQLLHDTLVSQSSEWSIQCCRGPFFVRPCLARVAHGLSDKLNFFSFLPVCGFPWM
jgi:hypothetical protein